MTKSLNELKKGEKGVISAIEDSGLFNRRVRALGITPGSEVLIKEKALFGDPINVSIRGLSIALRGHEAKKIIVEMFG